MKFLAEITKRLNLPEASTQEEILAKLDTQPVACKEALDALGLPDGVSKSELVATIHALKQRPDYSIEIAALKEKLAARERDEMVSAALKAGKITPAQKEWADAYALRDPEGFRLFVAKAPTVVPVGELGTLKQNGDSEALSEVQLEINKMLGISEETFTKYSAKS